MSAMTEQFNLNWKEHGLNTARTIHSLRDDDHLCDVTIACEEEVFLCHKIVLFASSLLFRNILRKHSHPHPLIYLKNITGRDMASLLDFMYFGEVKLEKEQLSSFSAAAEEMKVLGLTNSGHVKDLSRKCGADQSREALEQNQEAVEQNKEAFGQNKEAFEQNQEAFGQSQEAFDQSQEAFEQSQDAFEQSEHVSADQSPEVFPASSPQPLDWKFPVDEILLASMDNQTSRASTPLPSAQNNNCKPNIKLENVSQSVHEGSTSDIQSAIKSTEFEIQRLSELTDSSVESAILEESHPRPLISGQGLIKKSQGAVSNVPLRIEEYKDLQNFVIKGEKVSQGGMCRRRYECILCGVATVNKGHLLKHIEGKHFPKVLKYTCNRCGRSQGTRESAKGHMKRCKVSSAS